MILAQLNHHRTYLIGKDIELPVDGRMGFDNALRSNGAYPASDDLGEPTTFFGHDISRDDPPVADYDTIPSLPPVGNLLKSPYLRDGDIDDISTVDRAIDVKRKKIDLEEIMKYAGARFYHDLMDIQVSIRQDWCANAIVTFAA